ncbi:crossover junction endodeoxyribonuclease RuvC [Candidatus Omnitrophota bacterium]
MRILGVDPGLLRTGYGLIESGGPDRMKLIEAGTIKTSSGEGISQRVACIYRNLTEIIKEHKPRVLVLEKLYSHYKHPATSILMGHARGVVCLTCGINDVELINYNTLTSFVNGNSCLRILGRVSRNSNSPRPHYI